MRIETKRRRDGETECEPTFTTARLRVWRVDGVPDPECQHSLRAMFLACVTDHDWPGVAVSASVWLDFKHYVDWIQVSDAMRGSGYGQELLAGIEKHMGCELYVDPVSESSERMMARIEKAGAGAPATPPEGVHDHDAE